jgi:addiction module RelE/StbE family toxin
MRLEWSIFAQTDRDTIFDYIEADSPQAAIAVDNRIRVQVESLAEFPDSGRRGRVEGTRELVIQRTPYIAAYGIVGDTVRFCVCCTVPSSGPKICPKNRKSELNVRRSVERRASSPVRSRPMSLASKTAER